MQEGTEIAEGKLNDALIKLKARLSIDFVFLQQLWDYIFIVRTSIEDWKKTPWRKIDVENMDIECKKFAKDVRLLDKEMRGWDAYLMLEATVKNMLTSLRAVGELQNPAIRERHWIQLMASTKVHYYILLIARDVLVKLYINCIYYTRNWCFRGWKLCDGFVNKQPHNVVAYRIKPVI